MRYLPVLLMLLVAFAALPVAAQEYTDPDFPVIVVGGPACDGGYTAVIPMGLRTASAIVSGLAPHDCVRLGRAWHGYGATVTCASTGVTQHVREVVPCAERLLREPADARPLAACRRVAYSLVSP